MILNNINLTNNINLILLHRSLFILQKKFKQFNNSLKELYIKYGTHFEGEENLLIDEYKIPKLLNEIFNLTRFEISEVASFEEALYKEMEYCNEIITDEFIFQEFIDFIKTNRKKYNYIFRERRNNVNFELNDYQNLDINGEDDLAKFVEMKIDDDEEENQIQLRKIKTVYVLFKRYNLMELYDADKNSIYKKSVNMDKISGKYSLSKDEEGGEDGDYSESGDEEEYNEISDINEIDSNNEEEIDSNDNENSKNENNKNENDNNENNNNISNNENNSINESDNNENNTNKKTHENNINDKINNENNNNENKIKENTNNEKKNR